MRATLTLLLALAAAPAWSAEVVGRIVDAVDAKVFAHASVALRGPARTAISDAAGFFRIADVPPGAYVIDVQLADGRAFVARVAVPAQQRTRFIELDYSRANPPDDDEDY